MCAGGSVQHHHARDRAAVIADAHAELQRTRRADHLDLRNARCDEIVGAERRGQHLQLKLAIQPLRADVWASLFGWP